MRTPEDLRAFVQCAHEFVREVGSEEARRAFHEDERWKSGPIYVFVAELTPVPGAARALVQPPDPSREGRPWGLLVDDFGNDLMSEYYRIGSSFGGGWIYYAFTNPLTGNIEPKASYFKKTDWDGIPAAIGAGIYRRDLPGTCRGDEVNAAMLEADPSEARLQEFVRCAALELQSKGYFATGALSSHPRWRSNSIYLFGLDTSGNLLFGGDPDSRGHGFRKSELDPKFNAMLQGRNVVRTADTFGESFLYYWTRNPATGVSQRKTAFVKRVVAHGAPILVASGIYMDCPSRGCGRCSGTGDDATASACEAARERLAGFPPTRVNYGFYTDFNPVSYSVAPVPAESAFHRPRGYEPDLVAAVEIFSRGRLSFNRLGIGNPFSGIWLKAAQEPYDIVGGGITALPERTRDAEGQQVIRFGVGHISFRQSLLVRSESVINRHDDLTSEHRVGTLRGTTGEKRLLELTGIIDAAGFVRSGTQVQLAGGDVLIAGEPGGESALRIAAGTGSVAIASRVRLTPAGDEMPEVLYFNSESEQIGGLREGVVDAVARGEPGNRVTARDTPGLRVTAIDTEAGERGAFSYGDTPAANALRVAMNAAITCLTANGNIELRQWFDSDGAIFARRARQWR